MKTTVVQYVLDQEDDGAFPSEDFRLDDVRWHHGCDNWPSKKSVFYVTIKYSQKLKKTKEKFAIAFRRHLNDQKKIFSKNKKMFMFRYAGCGAFHS